MIIKFDSGGTAPFVSYTPLKFNTASNYGSSSEENNTKRGSSDSKESGKLTEKDLLMAIKDLDALPSDSVQLYDQMVDFIRMQEMGYADPTMLATQFIRMQQYMKNSVYRKNAFEEAYKNVKENNGLNEYAVTDTGDIVVASSDGGIKFASIEQVLSGEYKPLTNADLLRLRAESYAGNDTLTQIVSNGIGMEKIIELINTAMKTLGSDENKIEGYTRSPEQESILLLRNKVRQLSNNPNLTDEQRQDLIQELLMISESGVQEQGLYKFTNLDRNSQFQIKAALNYIYASLPQNARTILELRSNGNGQAMIMQLLLSTTNTTHQLDWDMIENENGVKPGTKESTESSNGLTTDFVLNVQNGYGGDYSLFSLNNGTNAQFSVEGINYRSIIDTNGNTIESTNLSTMLAKSGLQGISDTTSIYFGKQKISSDNLSKLVYRNNGGTRVLIPSVKENGRQRPNFEILDVYQKEVADKVNAEANENTTFEQRQRITAKYIKAAHLDELLDSHGLPDMNKFGVFFIVDGYANSSDIAIDENNNWAEQVPSDDNSAADVWEEAINRGKTKDEDKRKLDRKMWIDNLYDWMIDPYETLYKASIFIPIITNNKLQAITAAGKSLKYNTGKQLQDDYNNFNPDAFNKINQMKSNSSEQLWQQ